MIGVSIVTFNSASEIVSCLKSLFKNTDPNFRIVITDNSSSDNTLPTIRDWVSSGLKEQLRANPAFSEAELTSNFLVEYTIDEDRAPKFDELGLITILKSHRNLGFAGGVNAGLSVMKEIENFSMFWVLNPDTTVSKNTVAAYRQSAQKDARFSLMSCRIAFMASPDVIQSDGGYINRWTGICSNHNYGMQRANTAVPDISVIDYLSGSNLVASRLFIEKAGLMREDYFLYYEEVDWAFKRGDLPMRILDETVVYHVGGATIGSGNLTQYPNGFSNYFNFRNRIRFMARFFPLRLPLALAVSMLKITQILIKAGAAPAFGAILGSLQLPPSPAIKNRIAEKDRPLAFSRLKF